MKLTTIALGALAAVATLTGGANAQPNLRHRQLIQATDPAGLLNERRLFHRRLVQWDEMDDDESVGAQIGWYGDEMDDDESVGAQIGWYGDEMDDDESVGRALRQAKRQAWKKKRLAKRFHWQPRKRIHKWKRPRKRIHKWKRIPYRL